MDAEKMAREVAKELRKRGIWACVDHLNNGGVMVVVQRPNDDMRGRWYAMANPDFAGMTGIEIADEIQAQDARRAQEWAGDA